MRARFLTGAVIGMLIVLGLSCSTSNVGELNSPQRGTSGFSLNVLNDSFIDGSSAKNFDLTIDEYDQHVVVNVNVTDATDLKALYFEMTYDASSFRPMTVEPAEAMGKNSDLLKLQVFQDPGKLTYGQVLTNWQYRPGFSGNGMIASVEFKRTPAVVTRRVSVPPNTPSSKTIAEWNSSTNTLSWYYYNTGDYNQNSKVDIGDLTPLGANFGASAGAPPAKFPVGTVLSVVDANNDGLINIQDLAPIGINWAKTAQGGYNVYHSLDSADIPLLPADPSNPATFMQNVAFNTAVGTPADRKRFGIVIAAPVANDYYWVRPNDVAGGTGVDGTPSQAAGGPPAALTLTLTNPPASGDGSAATPYLADITTDYVFQVMDAGSNNVSLTVTYLLSAGGAGSIAAGSATLNITDAYTGTFSVQATDGTDVSNLLWLQIGAPGGDLDIYADPADTDWNAPVTGTGTEADPYVLDSADLTKIYSLLADDDAAVHGVSGNPIAVNSLTWDGFPPFVGTWTEAGSFQANQFTSGYVFAQQAGPPVLNSNDVWVEIHLLP
jgi:hypothetical protein